MRAFKTVLVALACVAVFLLGALWPFIEAALW